MSKQRYIHDSFWTDPYIEELNTDEKLLFLYYLTNPLCNIAGIYEIRDGRISYEIGIPENKIKIIKEKFVKDKKIVVYKDWICLCNFAKHQTPNPNVLTGMQRIIDDLPSDLKALKGFERLSHFTLLNLTIFPQSGEEKKTMKKNSFNYSESNSSDSYEDVIDADTGQNVGIPKKAGNKIFWELLAWGEKRRGFKFLNVKKQFKAFSIAKTAEIKPNEIMERWKEFEDDKFWKEKGFDFFDVINNFNKKR